MADLAGKAALVTGAQQGIGAAIAIALARAGADVAINYLDGLQDAEAVADAIRAANRWRTDMPISDQKAVAAVARQSALARHWPDLLREEAS